MGEKTNNYTPAQQAIVAKAIALSDERRAEMLASKALKTDSQIAKEIYVQMAEMISMGDSEGGMHPDHYAYVSAGLKKLILWSLKYSADNPPSHRKGFGESGVIDLIPPPLIFLFGGGGKGGPPPSDGDGLPDPEDPDDEGDFDWGVPADEVNRARATLDRVARETDFGPYDDPLSFVRQVARELGGRWGLNGKRGNPNDPSSDVLAWDYGPGRQPQLFDVLIGSGESNKIAWQPLPYGQKSGAVWLAP